MNCCFASAAPRSHRRLLAPLFLLAFIALLMSLGSSSRADITITFDDLKDGASIADTTPVIVRADGADGIDKVEFAVDDQLRFSTGSTPYTFKWDTIADMEGPHTLAVTAIDANGMKKTVKLALTINNELGLGADALAHKAREALQSRDTDTAFRFSRRALKADPENLEAARAFAAILASRQNWDRAIDSLSKAKTLSQNSAAMLELAAYRMHRAVLPENAAGLVADFQAAGDLRRKAADLEIDSLKAKNLPPDQTRTHEAFGDAYLSAGRYREAIQEYSKSGNGSALSSTNRLALAYALSDQAEEATILLRPLVRDNTGDAATRAVMGLALLRLRKFAEARETVRMDLAGGQPATLLVGAFADVALGNSQAAFQEAKSAAAARPDAGETHYALSMTLSRLADSEAEVVRALALSPFQTGPLIDYAVRYALLNEHPDRFETAIKILDIALKSEPENIGARLAKVLLLFHVKRVSDAEPILSDLVRREAQSADVQAAAAIYFDIKENRAASVERLSQAQKLDKDFFNLSIVPKPLELLFRCVRQIHYRGGFYFAPDTLYPVTTTASAAR